MKYDVAVVGSGPAGMLAAWAAVHEGRDVTIISPAGEPTPPENAGVFYLHRPCDLPLAHARMEILHFGGDAIEYGMKVYGHGSNAPQTSWGQDRAELAYDAVQALTLIDDILPRPIYERRVINPEDVDALTKDARSVIWTAPRYVLQPELECQSVVAWVNKSLSPTGECFTMYNAHPKISWYRCAAAFGTFTMEWPGSAHVDIVPGEARSVRKVVGTGEQLKKPVYDNLLLAGRYGTWDKRKLAHDAYYDTQNWLRGE